MRSPTTPPTSLLESLHRLNALLPQVHVLHQLLHSPKAPKGWATKARLLDQLLVLLPSLPAVSNDDLYPPPPIPYPALVVSGTGKAYLSHELVAALHLRAGQAADLWPPTSAGSACWHLDLRPEALRNIDWYPGKRPKIKRLHLRPGVLLPEQELTLRLLPGEPAFAQFYPLIPDYTPPALPRG